MTGAQNRGPPSVFSNDTLYRIFGCFLTTPRLLMMYDAFFKQSGFVYNLKFGRVIFEISQHEWKIHSKAWFSKWLKVFRNSKKVIHTIDNVRIVKKRRKKRLGLWKCRCATHSEVWMWRMHQCTFIEDSQLHDIRLLS